MFLWWCSALYTDLLYVFLKGLTIGCFVALPVGPIGIFCLRRMLTQGPLIGLISGIGGATADLVYASVAIVGLSFISPILQAHAITFHIISALFLCILGLKIFMSRPNGQIPVNRAYGLIEAYISTFFLTLANPLLILSFGALFAMFNVVYQELCVKELVALLVGVGFGSSIWWVILSVIFGSMRMQIPYTAMRTINMITGALIILASAAALLSILFA